MFQRSLQRSITKVFNNLKLNKSPTSFSKRHLSLDIDALIKSGRDQHLNSAAKGVFGKRPDPDEWSTRRILGALFFGSGAFLTSALCIWQVRRRWWKQDLVEYRENQIHHPPVELEPILKKICVELHDKAGTPNGRKHSLDSIIKAIDEFKENTQYRQVKLSGTFDYSKEQYVGMASPPINIHNVRKGETSRGFYIITPMILDEPISLNVPVVDEAHHAVSNMTITIKEVLVNRGWISSQSILSYHRTKIPESTIPVPEPPPPTWMETIFGTQKSPVFDKPLRSEIKGLLWYGQRCPKGEFPVIDIKGHGIPGFQFSHCPTLSLAMDLSPSVLTLANGSVIKVNGEYSNKNDMIIEKNLPILMVDLFSHPPSRRVPYVDGELRANDIRLEFVRKSSSDYNKFHATPTTHAAYAFTWASLTIALLYITIAKFIRPQVFTRVRTNQFKGLQGVPMHPIAQKKMNQKRKDN